MPFFSVQNLSAGIAQLDIIDINPVVHAVSDGGRLLAATTVLLCLCYVAFRSQQQQQIREGKRQQLKCTFSYQYPHSEPFLGLDLLWICTKALASHTFLETIRGILQDQSQTVEYLVLGNRAIATMDPENVKAVLSTNFTHFDLGKTRKNAMDPLLGNGIFNIDGTAWKHSRTLLRPHLSKKRDADLGIFEKHTQMLLKALPRDKSTFDLQDLFDWLALDITTEVLLGTSTDCLAPTERGAEGRQFAAAFEFAQANLCEVGRISIYTLLASLFGNSRLKDSLRFIDLYIEQHIECALKSGELQTDESLLHFLLKNTQDTGKVKKEVLNLLMAGKDTVKTLLSNVWFVIARRADAWQQLQDEIAVLNDQPPKFAQLSEMKYLRSVVNETLRLYPPVPLNQRTANVNTVLPHGGGPDGKSPILVEKGVSVGFNIYAMHRSETVFGPNADCFAPERWDSLKPGWAFLPFNGGPRTCLGQQYALSKVLYLTVRLAQHLSGIESRDVREWEESISLNTSSRNGVLVSVSFPEPSAPRLERERLLSSAQENVLPHKLDAMPRTGQDEENTCCTTRTDYPRPSHGKVSAISEARQSAFARPSHPSKSKLAQLVTDYSIATISFPKPSALTPTTIPNLRTCSSLAA